ncbi:small RNA 2'-O-methyltransferase isoform X2 [Lepidochelys kempii]|uniref:small RNA 2'-O-methyltransferase isoform X2 n=1 Tax=Lepidochelys kempii TaxID=8472 RepID=UPI003C6F46CD
MDTNLQKDDLRGTIKFIPPLYKQRYQFIKDLVIKYKPKKVADLGCADCTLLWMLKFCKCIEVLAGLDIRENVMKEKMHMLSPLPADYLQPSERSLTVTLHHGSVAHKDSCMLGFDLVTCIELIEHLEAAELEKFPEVVFGFMAPAMIVISTPNSEFNPLLPGVTLFRHSDHKFEWDQTQFQSWAIDAATRYDYTVEFTGLGTPPPGSEDVGFCTQIGVFVRKYPKSGETVNSEKHTEHAYKTVFKAVYPSLKDEKYLQNAVVSEVIFGADIIKRRLLGDFKSEVDGPNLEINQGYAVKKTAVCRSPVSFVAETGRCVVKEAGDCRKRTEDLWLQQLNAALENWILFLLLPQSSYMMLCKSLNPKLFTGHN